MLLGSWVGCEKEGLQGRKEGRDSLLCGLEWKERISIEEESEFMLWK